MRRPEQVWRNLWDKANMGSISWWDYQCDLIHFMLTKECGVFKGKTCLEGGSGTGRVSLKLGKEGTVPILLDVSKKVVKFAKNRAQASRINANFLVGSILNLPFKQSSIDIVWSDGVLEHFAFKKQQLIIQESLRVLKTKGKLIIIVPHKGAWFYNISRVLSMRLKSWPCGYEEPLKADDFNKFSPKPVRFHSGGFFWQFTNSYIVGVGHISRVLIKFFKLILKSSFAKVDQSHPGLFLAAVWIKCQ